MLLEVMPDHPEPRKIARAAEALSRGEIIAYPTDTVYGLGCDPTNKKAVERLYQIKQLRADQPLAFVCPDLSEISRYALVEKHTYRILRHYLPGPYCFVLEATREVPKMLQSKRRTIGIRIPNHAVPIALARELGRPILSTTATSPGAGDALIDPTEIRDTFHGLGLVLDAGAGGIIPTTVVDLTSNPPVVVREGLGEWPE